MMTVVDYVKDMLKQSGDDLGAVVEKANGQETTWLEFKADPFCTQEKVKFNDDMVWHVLKAVVAMFNTYGGCIVFGIDDNLDPVNGLWLHDGTPVQIEKGGLDAFHRDVTEYILKNRFSLKENDKSPNKIPYGLKGVNIQNYCEFKSGVTYKGKPVSVLFVHSPLDNDTWCWLQKEKNGHKEEFLLTRQLGSLGNTRQLVPSELMAWRRPIPDFIPYSAKKFDNMLRPTQNFQGRRDLIKKMRELFRTIVTPPRLLLLYGPSGIGKSELVYRYAEETSLFYDSLIRIDASRCGSFTEALAELAHAPVFRKRFLPELEDENLEQVGAERVFWTIRTALAEGKLGARVLIVLDDVRKFEVLRANTIQRYLGDLIPEHVHLIATSRMSHFNCNVNDQIQHEEVGPLKEDEGVKLLEQKRAFTHEADPQRAREIVRIAEGNPWALDLIGEYLKQKYQTEADYANCLESLKQGLPQFFPTLEGGQVCGGNSSGIVDLQELLAGTLGELSDDEEDICQLIARCGEPLADKCAVRAAFACLKEKTLSDEQWGGYLERLRQKYVICEKFDGVGRRCLAFCDPMLLAYFACWVETMSFGKARLEYIRVRCRSAVQDRRLSKTFLADILKSSFSNEVKLDVLFDKERWGWPLGLLGLDTVTRVLRSGGPSFVSNAQAGDSLNWNDIMTVCKLAENEESFKADAREIRQLGDMGWVRGMECREEPEVGSILGDRALLDIRCQLYSEDPVMLGRSYLHAAHSLSCKNGEGEEVIGLLDQAISHLETTEDAWNLAEAMDLKAYLLDESDYVNEGGDLDGETGKMVLKNGAEIKALLQEAYNICPDFYLLSANFDEEFFWQCVTEGRYPR